MFHSAPSVNSTGSSARGPVCLRSETLPDNVSKCADKNRELDEGGDLRAQERGPDGPLETVRAMRKRLIRDGRAVSRSDGSVHQLFPVGVPLAEGAAIRSWVIREAATHTIEIGLGYAISALFVCEGLLYNGAHSGRHVVIDPNQETRFANCGLQFLAQAGIDHIVEYCAEDPRSPCPAW